MLSDFVTEYRRYRKLGEGALTQMPDAMLNHIVAPDGNSAAMIVRHVSGNLLSRFTDFLTSDGEKPWRNRDDEFADREYTRTQVDEMWRKGWDVLEQTLATLSDADLATSIRIRGESLTVHAALSRSVSHTAYHVGQLVLLARATADHPWQSLSIPKGGSAAYNANPIYEKGGR